jgi:hemerythrin superfamily protein
MANESRTRKTSSRKATAKGRGSDKSSSRKGAATKRTSAAKGRGSARTATSKGRSGGAAGKGRSTKRQPAAKKSAAKRATASKSRSPIGQSIELLTDQHRQAAKLFREAERAKDDPQKLQQIVEQSCALLSQHQKIEEQYFYPVLRENMKDTEMVAEARVEHDTQKQLVGQLQDGDAGEERYAATFKVLTEYVKHHVKEEENEMFPRARRVRADWQPLLDALQRSERQQEQEGGRTARGMQGETATGQGSGALLGGGILAAEEGGEGAQRGRRSGSRRSARSRGSEETGGSDTEEGGTHGREQDQDEQATRGTRSGSR